MKLNEVFKKRFHFKRKISYAFDYIIKILFRAAQQLADEHVGQTRRNQYCIFVPGRPALTNAQAAQEIIAEAKILLQNDLQAMGFGIVIQKPAPNECISNSDTMILMKKKKKMKFIFHHQYYLLQFNFHLYLMIKISIFVMHMLIKNIFVQNLF